MALLLLTLDPLDPTANGGGPARGVMQYEYLTSFVTAVTRAK